LPSDVFKFSKLPEADQQAILRQANKDEFERYIGHAHMKLCKPMGAAASGQRSLAHAVVLRHASAIRRIRACHALALVL
jgi:hypothetical protein